MWNIWRKEFLGPETMLETVFEGRVERVTTRAEGGKSGQDPTLCSTTTLTGVKD